MDKTILNNKAVKNPFTAKPLTIVETSKTKSAFITKVKSPSVRIFTGKVIITRSGLMVILIIPRTTANTNAVQKDATPMPGTR